MSERSEALPRPEGEYFETNRFAGLSVLIGAIAFAALVVMALMRYFSHSGPRGLAHYPTEPEGDLDG